MSALATATEQRALGMNGQNALTLGGKELLLGKPLVSNPRRHRPLRPRTRPLHYNWKEAETSSGASTCHWRQPGRNLRRQSSRFHLRVCPLEDVKGQTAGVGLLAFSGVVERSSPQRALYASLAL